MSNSGSIIALLMCGIENRILFLDLRKWFNLIYDYGLSKTCSQKDGKSKFATLLPQKLLTAINLSFSWVYLVLTYSFTFFSFLLALAILFFPHGLAAAQTTKSARVFSFLQHTVIRPQTNSRNEHNNIIYTWLICPNFMSA